MVDLRGILLFGLDCLFTEMSAKLAISILKQTFAKWGEHQAPRLGASVAFYSVLSFAPLLVLITAVIALIFGQSSAQGALISEARQLIGDRGSETVASLLKNAQKPASGVFASVVAFFTLLFGASGVFIELQDALNEMWEASAPASSGLLGMIKQRLFSFGMVLSVGFLLLVSLVLSTGFAYMGRAFGQLLPLPSAVLETINFVMSFLLISILFALMFRYVPNVKVRWRDAGIGAVGTALLFTIGKMLLGIYLGKAGVGSTYGAAGSLVAVIVWIYYSAQIFFFGAEFTRVYADTRDGRVPIPEKPAVGQVSGAAEAKPQQSPPPTETPLTIAAANESHITAPATAASTSDRAPSFQAGLISSTRLPSKPTHLGVNPTRVSPPHRHTKPKLMMALGLGFVLGRVFASSGHNKPVNKRRIVSPPG